MNNIRQICIDIKNIGVKDLKRERKIAIGQTEYISPLKPATQGKQNRLGYHNLKILDKLVVLQELIKSKSK